MTDYLLIDGNSLGFAAQAMKKLHHDGQEIQAVFGILRSLRVLCDEHEGAEPIVFWDGRSWRYDQFAAYKGTRDDDPKQAAERKAYKAQRPIIARFLNTLGIRQVMARNMEADDLIALRSLQIARAGRHCTVVSGDRDLLQLVMSGVDWYNPIRLPGGKLPKMLRVTHETFEEDTGYESPVAFVKGKALLGDTSDNLDGIAGIGKKAAPLVVRAWPDMRDLIQDVRLRGDAAIPAELSRYKKKLKDFAADETAQRRFIRNYQLMRLTTSFIPTPDGLREMHTPYARNHFETLCKEYGFVSILRDLDNWARPFAERHAVTAAA